MNANENIGKVVGCEVSGYESYGNGFSFCVPTELDAYKSAYVYRNMPMVNVLYSANCECWIVQVYSKI